MTIFIPLENIHFLEDEEAQPLNPRGKITDTIDLQASMALFGQQQPIQVIPVDDDDYAVIDGHRRVTAARLMGWATIEAVITTSNNESILPRMLASNVRQQLKPTALGRAMETLIREGWAIERLAQLIGDTPDHAQLLVDLLTAPESLQRRVDMGEMSLTAWKAVRDKPQHIQEEVAELDKPTVRAVRAAVKKDASAGVLSDMLNQMQPDNTLVMELTALRTRLMRDWYTFSTVEQSRTIQVIEDMQLFMKENLYANHQ